MPSLVAFLPVRNAIMRTRVFLWNRFWGMSIDPRAKISLSAKMDRTYPKGMHVRGESYITFGVTLLAHDQTRMVFLDTIIEPNCFIGCNSIIMPGVTVGPNAIVAAGSVVTRDVPPNTIVAGNPAKVIKTDVDVGPFGMLRKKRPGRTTDSRPSQPVHQASCETCTEVKEPA